jgi:hypothetical protein
LTSPCLSELSDVPFGTGTSFSRRRREEREREEEDGEEDDDWLYREPRKINITEREEGLVAQFLSTPQGHGSLCEELEREHGCAYRLERIFSGVHAGQGRQWFGSSGHQLCDYSLVFRGDPGKPVALYYVNYHGMYYHYTGHKDGCPREKDGPPFRPDPLTEKLDAFRRELAAFLSELEPEKFVFRYGVLTTCDVFHHSSEGGEADLEDFLQSELPADCCLPRRETLWKKRWKESELVESILAGETTGFVTLSMGFEDYGKGCLLERNFGFCVQKRRPQRGELSDFTRTQIMGREGLQDFDRVDDYLGKTPERTFAAKSFFGAEETISTVYFCWLVRERGLHHYRISHFVRYKFCNYSRDFLQPILERRHEYKREKNVVGAECLKLIANGSFGYTALESRNYDNTTLKTDLSLRKNRFRLSSQFSMKNASFVGVVRCRAEDDKKRKLQQRQKQPKRRRLEFALDEAQDADEEEEEEEEEYEDDDALGFDRSWLREVEDSEDQEEEEAAEEEEGDLEEALCGENAKKRDRGKEFKFLYAVTVTGKYKKILNCIPRAVSILSNSKTLFLGLVLQLLRAADPAKVEPVYCDTDSIILSCQYSDLEANLKPGGKKLLRESKVIGCETGLESIHGKLKLEGVFSAGYFRALKVYRLFEKVKAEEEEALEKIVETACNPSAEEVLASCGRVSEEEEEEETFPNLDKLETVYTRCKGISRKLAEAVGSSQFAPSSSASTDTLKVHKASLRPTRAGEMAIQMDRRTLAQPYNFKRRVCADGIHSLPFD